MQKLIKYMNRTITYLLISGLIAVGIYAGYTAIRVEEKPKSYQFVTRAAVDSTQIAAYNEFRSRNVPVKEPIRWSEITSAIVALTVAFGTIGFKAAHSKINSRLDVIDETLRTVADQTNRDNVDQRLVKIEQDAAGFVDDENVKTLIEGMGGRTRSFCRDVMEMDFTTESLDNAKLKMTARNQDGKFQVKDLGFSDYFVGKMNEIRCRETKQLYIDLTRLVEDHLHNSKYERFGEIICRFQRNYMKAIIKLSNENKEQ